MLRKGMRRNTCVLCLSCSLVEACAGRKNIDRLAPGCIGYHGGTLVFVRVLVLRVASDKKGPEGEHEAGDREHVQHEEHQVVAWKK